MSTAESSTSSKQVTLIVAAILVVLTVALVAFWGKENVLNTFHSIEAWIRNLPNGPFVVCLFLLPLTGFPVAPVYVAAGIKYGSAAGLGLVACAISFHLLGAWLLAHFFREPLTRLMGKHAHWLKRGAEEFPILFILAIGIVPVVPYGAKNYVLALSKLRFVHYFWVTLPIHIVTSTPGIFVGDAATKPHGFTWILVGAYSVAIILIAAGIRRRLQKRLPS